MALIRRILGMVYVMSLKGERLEMLFDGDRASSLRRSMVTVQDLMNRC